jgi:hypothetical protein
MKRLFLISLSIALLVFSCNKEKHRAVSEVSERPDIGLSVADTDFVPVSTSSGGDKSGRVLRLDAGFYTLKPDTGEESDRTVWGASLALGELVTVGEKRRATFHGDGKVYDFVEVKRENGSEGIAWASQVAAGGRLAVVTDEKANLYSSPSDIGVTGSILPRKVVVVYYPENERDGIVEIKGYDPAGKYIVQGNRNNYIRRSSLSESNPDIQSAILLQMAEPLKNEGESKNRREALLNTAMQRYPQSVFFADITALLNPPTTATIATERADYTRMFANEDNVNIRDIPFRVGSKVIGQLNIDDAVTVDLQTVDTTTIEGYESRWYHITTPMVGWVFGRYIGSAN